MTEKFTPGPWTKMNATDVFERYWNGRQVADCMVDNDINYPQQKANAALIAATPELYEDLKRLVRRVEGHEMRKIFNMTDGLMDKIDADLKKARGT